MAPPSASLLPPARPSPLTLFPHLSCSPLWQGAGGRGVLGLAAGHARASAVECSQAGEGFAFRARSPGQHPSALLSQLGLTNANPAGCPWVRLQVLASEDDESGVESFVSWLLPRAAGVESLHIDIEEAAVGAGAASSRALRLPGWRRPTAPLQAQRTQRAVRQAGRWPRAGAAFHTTAAALSITVPRSSCLPAAGAAQLRACGGGHVQPDGCHYGHGEHAVQPGCRDSWRAGGGAVGRGAAQPALCLLHRRGTAPEAGKRGAGVSISTALAAAGRRRAIQHGIGPCWAAARGVHAAGESYGGGQPFCEHKLCDPPHPWGGADGRVAGVRRVRWPVVLGRHRAGRALTAACCGPDRTPALLLQPALVRRQRCDGAAAATHVCRAWASCRTWWSSNWGPTPLSCLWRARRACRWQPPTSAWSTAGCCGCQTASRG